MKGKKVLQVKIDIGLYRETEDLAKEEGLGISEFIAKLLEKHTVETIQIELDPIVYTRALEFAEDEGLTLDELVVNLLLEEIDGGK